MHLDRFALMQFLKFNEKFKELSLFLFKIFMVLKKTGGFIYFSS